MNNHKSPILVGLMTFFYTKKNNRICTFKNYFFKMSAFGCFYVLYVNYLDKIPIMNPLIIDPIAI